jgi:hypothetical protein
MDKTDNVSPQRTFLEPKTNSGQVKHKASKAGCSTHSSLCNKSPQNIAIENSLRWARDQVQLC